MCSCGSVSADRTLPVFWGGSRPLDPPGWGAAAPQIPRGGLDPNGGRPLGDPPGVISTSSKTIWPARCAITWAASGCDYGRALAGIHDLFKARGTLRDPGEALPTECTIEQKHMLAGGGGSTPSMGVCGAGAPPGTRGGSGERQPPRERMNHPKWPKRQPACVFFDRASGFAPRVKKAEGFTTPSLPPPKFQLHTSLRTNTRT